MRPITVMLALAACASRANRLHVPRRRLQGGSLLAELDQRQSNDQYVFFNQLQSLASLFVLLNNPAGGSSPAGSHVTGAGRGVGFAARNARGSARLPVGWQPFRQVRRRRDKQDTDFLQKLLRGGGHQVITGWIASRIAQLTGRRKRLGGDELRTGQRDKDEPLERIVRTRTGFYKQVYQELEPQQSRPGENTTFCVQQVQGTGDCLFHAIAMGIAFEDEGCHLDMYDESLVERVRDLRVLAVDTLTADPDRMLHLEGNESIGTGELVAAAAEQYNMTPAMYCNWMRKKGVWGGGPEILALANALERPIHVFEPVPVNNGTHLQLQLCGAFGSPLFDERARVCICAADDRFPNCRPVEVKRHGEGGNHFLALLPTNGRCLPELAEDDQ